jgi:hypothetical protein
VFLVVGFQEKTVASFFLGSGKYDTDRTIKKTLHFLHLSFCLYPSISYFYFAKMVKTGGDPVPL